MCVGGWVGVFARLSAPRPIRIVRVPVGADGRVGCVGYGLGAKGGMHNAHLTG